MTNTDFGSLTTLDVNQLPDHSIAVQPIGAVEQHGAHLPLITDALIARCVAEQAAARSTAPAYVLPTVFYGKSTEHLGFAGTIALSTETLIALCRDVGRSLAQSGLTKLLFVNGHGGQPHLLEMVSRDIRADTGMQVFVVTPMRFGAPPDVVLGDAEWGIHGGELETSVMLALAPELVRMDQARPGGLAARDLFDRSRRLTLEGVVPTAWITDDLSVTGVIGDPTPATQATGVRIAEHWVNGLTEAIDDIGAFRFPARDRS